MVVSGSRDVFVFFCWLPLLEVRRKMDGLRSEELTENSADEGVMLMDFNVEKPFSS